MTFPTKLRNTLLFLVSWRLCSVYIVQTFHVPDEYFQSLEVAHRLAFGYGFLTWEWGIQIRSYIYPLLISVLYRLLAFLRLDYTILLTTLPRIFQALLAGYADYRFYLWTRSKWALFSLCANWFWYYCATRTLTNSVETALTTIALSIFPWPDGRHQGSKYLWIVGFLVVIRPTAAIIWTPLCFYHICTSSQNISRVIESYKTIGICTLFYSILIDSLCYQNFVVTPWEFFKINFINGVGTFYGTHHMFWYIIAGVPCILGLQAFIFPLAALRALRSSKSHRQQVVMIGVICWTITIYSTLAHKEFRFILPLLPMFIHVCTSTNFSFGFRITEFKRKVLVTIFVLSNLLPGLYFSVIHQRGSLEVMKSLEYELANANASNINIMFLTSCHATPMYSHLHDNVPIKILNCEPNVYDSSEHVDETDKFFADPMGSLKFNMEHQPQPYLLVLFDNLFPRIMPFLKNYQLTAKIFHAHFPQPNYGEYILIYRRMTEEY